MTGVSWNPVLQKQKREGLVLLAVLLILSAAFILLALPCVKADEGTTEVPQAEEDYDSITGTMGAAVYEDMENTLEDMQKTDRDMEEITDILLGTNSGFLDAVSGPNGLGTAVMNALKAFAFGLVMIFLFINILEEVMKGKMTMEAVTRVAIKLSITVFVIVYIGDIAKYLESLGAILVKTVNKRVVAYEFSLRYNMLLKKGMIDSYTSNQVAYLKQAGLSTEAICDILPELKGSLAFVIDPKVKTLSITDAMPSLIETSGFANAWYQTLKWSIKAMSYTIFLELAIRKAFMPIAMVSILDSGVRSPGVRYLKKYFGVYLRMAIVLVSVGFCNVIYCTTELKYLDSINAATNIFDSVRLSVAGFAARQYDAIMCKGAAIALINNASDIVNDILGTRQ